MTTNHHQHVFFDYVAAKAAYVVLVFAKLFFQFSKASLKTFSPVLTLLCKSCPFTGQITF